MQQTCHTGTAGWMRLHSYGITIPAGSQQPRKQWIGPARCLAELPAACALTALWIFCSAL
jgi:hypothetical protein